MPSEPDPLTQAIIKYLFPRNGPVVDVAKGYGACEVKRLLVSRLSEDLQRQLIRLCDLSPVAAVNLINFTIEVSDESFEAGREDAIDHEISEAEERSRNDERERLRSRWFEILLKEFGK